MSTITKKQRLLLKLSGEALMGDQSFGIDPKMISRTAREIAAMREKSIEIAIVIGGGNIFRGAGLAQGGLDRVTGDHIGMLATVMNSLALSDALKKCKVPVRVFSSFQIGAMCEVFSRDAAVAALEDNQIVIFAAGTGNPFFTTDTAASLRAIEIHADLMVKATKVDGVFDADPVTNPDAKMYDRISYDDAIKQELAVMDLTAMVLCRDHHLPMRVCNLSQEGELLKLADGVEIGTYVYA
ncbi:MAG: UMP kinase [Gammaproteobacteria bacterium]|nr:UMP kinase [Gammaproteobacteria bacterium]